MQDIFRVRGRLLLWALVTTMGCVVLARIELARLRDSFETDARISHRLLSQRAVQHDAVLATLALLQPASRTAGEPYPEQRLASVYPQILGVLRRDPGAQWQQPGLAEAEAESRQTRRAALANLDFSAQGGRYQLVIAAQPTSYALLIDVHSAVPWAEWSMPVDSSPVRVSLEHVGQRYLLQLGRTAQPGWRFEFNKHLASDSQPFDVHAVREVGLVELPWWSMGLWAVLVAAVLAAGTAWQRQRSARRRAEELLRLGQVARLNTLGELAAGMAHELSQPLTAVLANTQAAKRLLQDDPAEAAGALQAMEQAVAQARRASEVLGRLRRAVEPANPAQASETVDMAQAVRDALYLLEPECRKRGVVPVVHSDAPTQVVAGRVALEQIVHNLLMNALQALDAVPVAERQLTVTIAPQDGMDVLTVRDSGPGIAADALPRLFEPFFTTRQGGLGLGLSLCETLATGMGGTLRAEPGVARGAVFVMSLPLAERA